ncbi:MAG TPA: hypothetical protein VH370_11635 [Humisphaera sp.]|nr:hypothetical protein [Humisphaera sp.]
MNPFYQRLHEDLDQLCDRIDLMLVNRVQGAPPVPTVEMHGTTDDGARITLYPGSRSNFNEPIPKQADEQLMEMFSNPPYRLLKRSKDVGLINYVVRRSLQPAAPAPAEAAPAAEPATKAPTPAPTPDRLAILVTDTNVASGAHPILADALTEIGFIVEQRHKATLSAEAAARVTCACEPVVWKAIFGKSASAYCGRLAQLTAQKPWPSRRELRSAVAKASGTEAAKLQRFAKMLADAKKRHGDPIESTIAYEALRMCIRLPAHDEDETVEVLARFTELTDAIIAAAPAVSSKIADGKRGAIKLEEGGFAIQWPNKADGAVYGQRFDPAGKPHGSAYRADSHY